MLRSGVMAVVILVGCTPPPKPPPSVEVGPVPSTSTSSSSTPVGAGDSPMASASVAPPSEPPPAPGDREPTEQETRECAARGGTMQPVCMQGELACVIKYRDAGKRCADKRDCTGECLYEGPDPPPPSHAIGVCQRTSDPCGCKALIHAGHVEPTLCAD